ncbi:MAG: hypothetical protein IKQ60_04775 [Candidatus Methanomethylophilaceae archaeon]|nr:hypothetical protein [Candidatus Methanomethylophilaceae archaeon]
MYLMSALLGNEKSALEAAKLLMDGEGVIANPELALRMMISLADGGMAEAQEVLGSMTRFELADCDGEGLRSAGYPEGSWGRKVLGLIDAEE